MSGKSGFSLTAAVAARKGDSVGRVRLMVPQGIGDVFWVWQKLRHVPGVEEIEFVVYRVAGAGHELIVRRAEAVIGALPKVAAVHYYAVPGAPPWVAECRPLTQVLPAAAAAGPVSDGWNGPGWAANAWLESGINLERIDPSLPVSWDTGVTAEPVAGVEPGRYLVVYASGDTARNATLAERVWPAEGWARLADRVCYGAGVGTDLPVVLVGAAFDYPVLGAVADGLARRGFKTGILVDLPLPRLLGLFANAWGFLGYQSGLNILAATVGARQHIVYFPRIGRMGATWVRPEHRADGRFTWSTFDTDPDETAARIRFPAPA